MPVIVEHPHSGSALVALELVVLDTRGPSAPVKVQLATKQKEPRTWRRNMDLDVGLPATLTLRTIIITTFYRLVDKHLVFIGTNQPWLKMRYYHSLQRLRHCKAASLSILLQHGSTPFQSTDIDS